MTIACVYASGLIEFREAVNLAIDGVIPFADGPSGELHDFVSGLARHGYSGELLIPGMPECGEDQSAALEKLHAFGDRLRESKSKPNSVSILTGSRRR